MQARFVRFGVVELDHRRYECDVVVIGKEVRRRHRGPSKVRRAEYGHTPLTLAERIPWDRPRLIVGTGADGRLPVVDEVVAEAHRRGVELVLVPTQEACRLLALADADRTAALLHVTC